MNYIPPNNQIAYFDLRNIICDPKQDRHALLFQKELAHNIQISFYNNFYYFLDCASSSIPELVSPIDVNNMTLNSIKEAEASIHITLKRELINAFNALINLEIIKNIKAVLSNNVKKSIANYDIDNFLLIHTASERHDALKDLETSLSFSSTAYELAYQYISKENCSRKYDIEIVLRALENFSILLKKPYSSYNLHPFYILANLWKAVFYIQHDLRIDASIKLRSVFESLLKIRFPNAQNISSTQYTKFCDSDEANEFFKKMSSDRNNAAHQLIISTKPEDYKKYANFLIDFFVRDFGIDINTLKKLL